MRTYHYSPATSDSVGDWDGQEQLAADNFNRLAEAVIEAWPEPIEVATEAEGPDDDSDAFANAAARESNERELAEVLSDLWDRWGSDESLLTLTDAQIASVVGRGVHGVLAANALAVSRLSARRFADEVCHVNERTVRGWLDGTRPVADGTGSQLLQAIIAHPEIVATLRAVPRRAKSDEAED